MINYNENICREYEEATSREWLETNGIGGFAASTISGAHTRRYHALLTAATKPPLGRLALLSKYEETLLLNGVPYELSTNRYEGGIYPAGCKYLKSFRLDPFPVWVFEIEKIEIEKKIFMVNGENTTVCRWTLISAAPENQNLQLVLKPLLAFRDYHHLRREDNSFNGDYKLSENTVSIQPFSEMPALYFAHNAGAVEKSGFWYRDFHYAIEKERGFDFTEDLFQPFMLRFDLSAPAAVIASTNPQRISGAENFESNEIERRAGLVERAGVADDYTKQLILAADQFIVSRGDGKTVIAGYPWFSDWGRDTMIALNGLTMATNRPEIARGILSEYSKHISEGMIPNRFPDEGETPEYNTVDATLWYFEAVRAYVAKTGDYRFVQEHLYEKLIDIIVRHLRGTRYNIHVDADDLLHAGAAGTQLTWMDAKIGDYVATPRTGKAVEIQALWYNALMIMANLAEHFADAGDRAKYLEIAEKTKKSFNEKFWNAQENCLYDAIDGDEKDGLVRPNQIFAVSLPHAVLTEPEKARKVVEKVESELLTPVGLRSLSPNDSQYRPIYTGTPFERDSSYHQGTVWAWLIGGFVDAHRKVYGGEESAFRIEKILENFESHLSVAGVGQISEIFDGDAPHYPRGCFAQAWSVAEVLRIKCAQKQR